MKSLFTYVFIISIHAIRAQVISVQPIRADVNSQRPLQFFEQSNSPALQPPFSPLSMDLKHLTDQQLVNILIQMQQHDTSRSATTSGSDTLDTAPLKVRSIGSRGDFESPMQVTGVERAALSADTPPTSVASFARPDKADEKHARDGQRAMSENPWTFGGSG